MKARWVGLALSLGAALWSTGSGAACSPTTDLAPCDERNPCDEGEVCAPNHFCVPKEGGDGEPDPDAGLPPVPPGCRRVFHMPSPEDHDSAARAWTLICADAGAGSDGGPTPDDEELNNGRCADAGAPDCFEPLDAGDGGPLDDGRCTDAGDAGCFEPPEPADAGGPLDDGRPCSPPDGGLLTWVPGVDGGDGGLAPRFDGGFECPGS